MPRLPLPGKDNDNWGSLLNEYLLASHTRTGELRKDSVNSVSLAPGAVTAAHISNGAITDRNLSADLKTKIDDAVNSPKIWHSTNEPKSANSGDLWLDTSNGTPVLQAKIGAAWLAVGGTTTTAVQSTAMTIAAAIYNPATMSLVYRLSSGSSADAGNWWKDQYYSGNSSANSTTNTVDLTTAAYPGPQEVYKTRRYTSTRFSYNLGYLTAGTNYLVRLHFNESYANGTGQRVFDISANGNLIAGNFDIYAEAGGMHRALIKDYDIAADSTGKINITFTAKTGNVIVCGLEIYSYNPVSSGTNILVGKVFSSNVADSATEIGNPIANITDGNQNSRWISQPTSPMNATVDMGGTYNLSKITVVWAADTIKNYQLQISSNNSNWTTIATGVTNNTTKQTVDYTSFSATANGRYLRIVGTDRWNSAWGNSIWEVMAYGTLVTTGPSGSVSGLSATTLSTSSVKLSWAYSGSSLNNFNLKRNGVTIATIAAGDRSYTDSGLSAGTTYNYSLVGNFQTGGTTNTASVSAITGSVPVSGGWSSGGGGEGTEMADGSFGTWRGRPVTVIGTWSDADDSNRTNLWSLASSGVYKNWKGDVDLAVGGFRDGTSWADAANGGSDAMWTQSLQRMKYEWDRIGRTGTLYIRLAHEFNGGEGSQGWSLEQSNVNNFIAAWRRYYNLKQQIFPTAKLVFCSNSNSWGSGHNFNWTVAWPGDAYVDVYATDWYSGSYRDSVINGNEWSYGAPHAIERHRQFAQSHGKPFAVPEWGVHHGNTGDDAGYVQYMYDFFNANAGTGPGKLLYECYFNISQGYADGQFKLYPTTVSPNAAAKYKQLF